MRTLHRSNGSRITYARGCCRINEQKHPEIAWAADTYYLSHLAATLDNQPVLSSPWQMLQECQRGHSVHERARVQISVSVQEKDPNHSQDRQIMDSHYLENFLATHHAFLNLSQKNNSLTISRQSCRTFLQTAAS